MRSQIYVIIFVFKFVVAYIYIYVYAYEIEFILYHIFHKQLISVGDTVIEYCCQIRKSFILF